MIRILLLAAALGAPAQPSAAQGQKLFRVLLGRAPAPKAPPFAAADAEGSQPLYVVISTPYEIRSELGSYVHVVAYTPDFSAAANATVFVNGHPVGITDRHGTLVFRNAPEGNESGGNSRVAVVLERGGTRFVGWTGFESYARSESFERTRLFVYADRGVYHPGQRICARALVWRLRGAYEPLAGKPIEINLLDKGGHAVAGARVETDEFGVGSLVLPLPENMPEGRYALAVQYENSREQTEVRVERFLPSAIAISHTLKPHLARTEETLRFSVALAAFSGPPPREGELAVRVTHGTRTFFVADRAINGAETYRFELDRASFVELAAAVPEGDSFRVEIRATDASGRVGEVRRDLRLVANPYLAVLEADKAEYVPGESAKIQVKLLDLDGVPVGGKRVHLDVDPGPGPQGGGRTTDSGLALFEVPMRAASTDVEVAVRVENVKQPIATTVLYVSGPKPMFSNVRVPVVREGHRVPIEVTMAPGYEPVEEVVHGDIVDNSGALVSSFLIPISRRGEAHVARGSFVAPRWGTMLLTLFCAAKHGSGEPSTANIGVLAEGQKITVEPNAALSITLSGVPARVHPGQNLRLLARVKNARGQPVTSSLGVSLVNGPALSILDPLEVTPADRFYKPEPSSTDRENSPAWPVLTRNWGDFIGMSPFGVRPSGPPTVRRWRPKIGSGDAAGPSAVPSAEVVENEAATTGVDEAGPRIAVEAPLPATAVWIGHLVAKGGRASLEVTVPDAVGRHRLTVVASDRTGGVGSLQQEIAVHQDLVAQCDLPPTLVIGDTVETRAVVHNLSDSETRATLSLYSEDLEVLGGETRELTIPPGVTVGADFRVRARQAGRAAYEVRVRGGRVNDTERHELTVLPAGAAVVSHIEGSATQDNPFVAEEVDAEVALVSVSFPGAGAFAPALAAIRNDPASYLEVPGSRAVTAYYAMRLLRRHGLLTTESAGELREAIAADLLLLSLLDDDRGGLTGLRTGGWSPYLAGRALEAMAVARRSGFIVAEDRIAAAGRAILALVDRRGLIGADDTAWWEGAEDERRYALTAELFRILCEAGPAAVPADSRAAFERVRDRMRGAVNLTADPLALANLGLGLLAYYDRFEDRTVEDSVAVRLVRRLLEAQHRGQWEPSWFHAARGTVEATAAAIELLWALDSAAAEPLVPEATQLLLGARDLFAGWHDARGTAATMRALSVLPPIREEQWATVTVAVNRREVARTRIDPADPVASALALARVDVTRHLSSGANRIEVDYTGRLEPRVSVETRNYRPEPTPVESHSATRFVSRTSARVGETIDVSLTLHGSHRRPIAIEESLPANVTVDPASLAGARERAEIADFRMSDRLIIYLPELIDAKTIRYQLVAIRSGRASFGPTLLRPLDRPEETLALGESTTVVVTQ